MEEDLEQQEWHKAMTERDERIYNRLYVARNVAYDAKAYAQAHGVMSAVQSVDRIIYLINEAIKEIKS